MHFPRYSEIQEPCLSLPLQDDVGGLDVTMDDSCLMEGGHAFQKLKHDVFDFCGGKSSASLDFCRQSIAADIFLDYPCRIVFFRRKQDARPKRVSYLFQFSEGKPRGAELLDDNNLPCAILSEPYTAMLCFF